MLDLIYSQLNTDAPLTAVVGGEIYPYIREQGTALPAVFIEQHSATFKETMRTTSLGDEFNFTVFSVSQTLSESISLGNLVRAVLDGLSGNFTIATNSYTVHRCKITNLRTDFINDASSYVTEADFSIFLAHEFIAA